MKELFLPLMGLLFSMALEAQPRLDECHLLLDGALTDEEIADQPFMFNLVQEVMRHLSDTTTIYIRPWVYWVDNPDTPEVREGLNGREPFGMVIRTGGLSLIGLGKNPGDVVLASARGQMQGAVGNFTMFDFHVDKLHVENLTMGNFCNVDLDFPLHPQLSRPKRSEAITQAHVGYVHGKKLTAHKVRFISRLNLNPLNGAEESIYDNCHFECTDDALNGGKAIYRHCDFDLYGSKPFWSTFGTGPLLVDCDFYVKSDNHDMYFCKQGGPLTLVDCRYHAPEGCYLGWTAYPQSWLRCYQRHFTMNGQPYTIGHKQGQNSVELAWLDTLVRARAASPEEEEAWLQRIPHLAISQHEVRLRAPGKLTLTSEADVTWLVEEGYELYAFPQGEEISATPQGGTMGKGMEEGRHLQSRKHFALANGTNETASFCIIARSRDGREAACHVVLSPSLLPAPQFVKEPSIVIENGVARLDYQLDLTRGLRDQSEITWRRDGIVVSMSHDSPQRTYQLTQADRGHVITASIMPRHQRSRPTAPSQAEAHITEAPTASSLITDFHDFPTLWQPQVLEGFWTVDGYKPTDTAEFDWSFNREKPMWAYAEGFNGAVGQGLVQEQRGARLMYTPQQKNYGDMTLTLHVDPTKTAGQGFGSATGQYMDVCLKFDTRSLTGYGLRIIRTAEHAKAVSFLLVEYNNGNIKPLTAPIVATCYRTGCTIDLSCQHGVLTAHVETATAPPANSALPHEVDLRAKVHPNTFGGIHIQHTGSCGESTTMLHRLEATWL